MAKKKKRKAAPGDVATNRQASFRFNLLDKFEAGGARAGDDVAVLIGRNDHRAAVRGLEEHARIGLRGVAHDPAPLRIQKEDAPQAVS